MSASDIKPNGYSQADMVDLLYQIVASIKGICQKLDLDSGVPLTTYTANCYTAIFDINLEDSRGNALLNGGKYKISPTGATLEALQNLIYEIFYSWETLMTQLDTDVLGSSDYLANYFTATYLWKATNSNGTTKGNGSTYYFGPTSYPDDYQLVNLLYAIVNSLYLACVHLDSDSVVSGTNYTSLWYTAKILIVVENSTGNQIGNAKMY
jgi:hypothetical protein